MGFLDLFGGDSSSSSAQNTTTTDQAETSQSGAVNRVDTTGNVTISSDPVALAAISTTAQSAKDSLAAATSLISSQLTQVFQNINAQEASAATTIAGAQQAAETGITQATATASSQVTKFIYVAMFFGLLAFAVQKGYFK